MNIPAYTSPTLRLGRTFNAETSSAGSDIFPVGIQTELKNVNTFSFKYKVVKSSKDVNNLLDVSGELSLKIKANVLKVEGTGQYINENKTEEGTTNLLAVMKCTTEIETIVGQPTPEYDKAFIQGIGEQYVRSITYGAEMVASLKFKSSLTTVREEIHGSAKGELSLSAVNVGLKASLDKLSSECKDVSDITIKYYATDMPDKLPTTLEDLVSLIENFPSRLQRINKGKGIPMKFELLPTKDIIPMATECIQQRVSEYKMEELENRFDDLRNALASAKRYQQSAEEIHDDVQSFLSEVDELLDVFYSAISTLSKSEGQERVDACLDAYKKALDGCNVEGKFFRMWNKILSTKPPTKKPLTIVLLGKTGNGKSATGNGIIGKEQFDVSDGAQSETPYCQKGSGTIDDREVTVIDTPGILDTSVVKMMGGYKSWLPAYKEVQERILTEFARMYAMAPQGFDAIILVAKFGARFTAEDAEALNLLKRFLGKESEGHMILLLTRGDEAVRNAQRKKISPVEKYVRQWIGDMPEWVRDFIHQIGGRIVLFNNLLEVDTEPEAYHRQLQGLIKVIETMTKGKGPFVNDKTQNVLNSRIEDALAVSGYTEGIEDLKKKLEMIERDLMQESLGFSEKKNLQESEIEIKKKIEEYEKRENAWRKKIEQSMRRKLKDEGGCYPGSAIFVDKHGRTRQMNSLELGDEVQVVINNEIRAEPVITFIHRQPEVMQEFLQITTEKNNILKISEDHLLFVEKTGKATAIPARDVKVGDILYVRAGHSVERDAVLSISKVYEKGVYAPVTLSGTILVNDVHTSCYFDVLSHEWSHRAMGVARAMHYVSPWILQWISGVGQKDGFPGWCRLVHKMLTD